MELSDFGGLALLAVLLMLPLSSVYFVLKRMGWGKRNRLFLDAWHVWLAWLISSLVVWVFSAVLDQKLRFSGFATIAFVSLPALFTGNLLAVAAALKWIVRSDAQTGLSITPGENHPFVSKPTVWKASLFTNLSAVLTLVALFGLAAIVGTMYDKLYPPQPKTRFQIYDI